jgi:DNA invertase Pin-like site-specific DNA recombinase
MILSYTRVSTLEQDAPGTTSMAEQARRNKAIATLRGAAAFDFANYQDAGVSGTIPLAERPAGRDMLANAKPGDVIVATKMDRLFRSARDALVTADALKQRGIDLILTDIGTDPITGNGAGKLFFGIMANVAEFERERIAERMSDGRRAKTARGGYVGGEAPYGYRRVGVGRQARLEPDPEEQDIVRMVAAIRQRHGYRKPYRITKVLAELGIKTRRGTEMTRVQVTRMLRQAERMGATGG